MDLPLNPFLCSAWRLYQVALYDNEFFETHILRKINTWLLEYKIFCVKKVYSILFTRRNLWRRHTLYLYWSFTYWYMIYVNIFLHAFSFWWSDAWILCISKFSIIQFYRYFSSSFYPFYVFLRLFFKNRIHSLLFPSYNALNMNIIHSHFSSIHSFLSFPSHFASSSSFSFPPPFLFFS